MSIYIGTSGFSYDCWKDDFYPGVPRTRWLEYCAEKFTGLEINGSFYRLSNPTTLRDWKERTPEAFRFTMKAHRFLTHNKKLAGIEESIPRSREPAKALGRKLSVILWQVHERLLKNMERLESFARALRRWPGPRHALELRHTSWFDAEVAAFLAQKRIASCISDAADWPLWDAVTTDLVYVRLHGRTVTYASQYDRRALRPWARSIERWRREGREVHVYFDNDRDGHAPKDALKLIELVG